MRLSHKVTQLGSADPKVQDPRVSCPHLTRASLAPSLGYRAWGQGASASLWGMSQGCGETEAGPLPIPGAGL